MCLFCKIPRERNFINIEDTIIDESENFYAKPALGQFVNGYILINSKKHYSNYSLINNAKLYNELQEFISKVSKNIRAFTNSEILLFEHGSINKYCQDILCNAKCVDHAHFHLLPIDLDIHSYLKEHFTFFLLNGIDNISSFNLDSYIYYKFQNKEFIYKVDKPIQSQFVRQVICQSLGIGEKWNWKLYPYREKIAETINLYCANLHNTLVA
jgi:diadenosine tetraphosphate (Ap4A) HIT family hydrolase